VQGKPMSPVLPDDDDELLDVPLEPLLDPFATQTPFTSCVPFPQFGPAPHAQTSATQ
jgi:hypothetical protein